MQDYPEIYLKDLSLVIGRQVILRGINTRFTGGKIYGLIGHNGSGKTMLMKCICGFVRPTAGGVRINGKWLGLEQDFPESLGALIEAPGFLPYYTGQKNLRLLAGLRGQQARSRFCALCGQWGWIRPSARPSANTAWGCASGWALRRP